jgi:hypothetical protein
MASALFTGPTAGPGGSVGVRGVTHSGSLTSLDMAG